LKEWIKEEGILSWIKNEWVMKGWMKNEWVLKGWMNDEGVLK